jgi:ribonuclease HI
MEESGKTVIIYTDGACSGNPGAGGWGAVLMYAGVTREIWGGDKNTTNNRMELTAAIRALATLKHCCRVEIYTDSQYVKNGISSWINSWKKNGWKNSKGEPVVNKDLWQELDELVSRHSVRWFWVPGHSGDRINNRVDELAKIGIKSII